MISKDRIFKSVKPKIPSWVDSDIKEEILDEVGRYVATEIALHVGDGKSPVDGEGLFKQLSKEYADKFKGGDRLPNLEYEGDMMGALEWSVEMDEVKVGWFKKDQAIKAYGHNTGMKGHPWLDGKTPVRKSIPDIKEKFVQSIEDGIQSIVDDMVSRIEIVEEERDTGTEGSSSGSQRSNSINWLNNDDDDDGWL